MYYYIEIEQAFRPRLKKSSPKSVKLSWRKSTSKILFFITFFRRCFFFFFDIERVTWRESFLFLSRSKIFVGYLLLLFVSINVLKQTCCCLFEHNKQYCMVSGREREREKVSNRALHKYKANLAVNRLGKW
uniref:Uncharacterized protein n=1 Tax=Cacopsylla melanoneura TaxID=428564 RepID=A0A8D8V5B1_9HEMI